MATRNEVLTAVKGGIDRLRTKGAAPRDALYDLLNGYVTTQKTVKIRPGTVREATLPTDTAGEPLTRGLVSLGGMLHVFAADPMDVPDGFVLHVLSHPDGLDTNGDPVPLSKIHFAAPIMGYLYVAAEFEGGDVYHFWLQEGDEWEADTVYKLGDVVTPATSTGLSYQATRTGSANPSWAAGVRRTVGDVIEPTTYNDFYYTAVDTQGSNPRSGDSEPTWPTEDGQQVYEDADIVAVDTPTVTQTPDPTAEPSTIVKTRYGWTTI